MSEKQPDEELRIQRCLKVLRRIRRDQNSGESDGEKGHAAADDALLVCIDDERVKRAWEKLEQPKGGAGRLALQGRRGIDSPAPFAFGGQNIGVLPWSYDRNNPT